MRRRPASTSGQCASITSKCPSPGNTISCEPAIRSAYHRPWVVGGAVLVHLAVPQQARGIDVARVHVPDGRPTRGCRTRSRRGCPAPRACCRSRSRGTARRGATSPPRPRTSPRRHRPGRGRPAPPRSAGGTRPTRRDVSRIKEREQRAILGEGRRALRAGATVRRRPPRPGRGRRPGRRSRWPRRTAPSRAPEDGVPVQAEMRGEGGGVPSHGREARRLGGRRAAVSGTAHRYQPHPGGDGGVVAPAPQHPRHGGARMEDHRPARRGRHPPNTR